MTCCGGVVDGTTGASATGTPAAIAWADAGNGKGRMDGAGWRVIGSCRHQKSRQVQPHRGPARGGTALTRGGPAAPAAFLRKPALTGVGRRGPTASAAGVRPQQPQRRQRLIMVKGVQRGGQRVETGAKLLSKQALHPAELCMGLEVAHVQLGLQRIQQPGLGALAPGQLRVR